MMLAVVEAGQEQLVQLVLGVAAASGDVTWQGEDLHVLVAAAQGRSHWGVLVELGAGGGGGAVVWTQKRGLDLLCTASYAGVTWLVGVLLDGMRTWLTRDQLALAVTAAACTGRGSSSVLQLLLQQTQGWSLELQAALTVAAQRGNVGALQMLVSAIGLTMMGVHWEPGPAAGGMGDGM